MDETVALSVGGLVLELGWHVHALLSLSWMTTKCSVNRHGQGEPQGPCLSKFPAYLVILCFEKQCPKQNTVACLKSNYLVSSKILAGYTAGYVSM